MRKSPRYIAWKGAAFLTAIAFAFVLDRVNTASPRAGFAIAALLASVAIPRASDAIWRKLLLSEDEES